MLRIPSIAAVLVLAASLPAPGQAPAGDEPMTFFVTSEGSGDGADLGGLEGADAHCQDLAAAAGAGDRTWRAYLSATTGLEGSAVDARDRIGEGPWHNAEGVRIASDVAELHGHNNVTKETALDENGEVVNGSGDDPNRHDILTGSRRDGTAYPGTDDTTCRNWTSDGPGRARVGHHDRGGGGWPSSWNSAHDTEGCGEEELRSTGGDGLFYCFAVD